MSLLPIFLTLDGRRCLLVGAGTVALDKIGSLLKTGLRLTVIAPDALPEVQELARQRKLEWIPRAFSNIRSRWQLRRDRRNGRSRRSTPKFIASRLRAASWSTVWMTFRIAISSSAP